LGHPNLHLTVNNSGDHFAVGYRQLSAEGEILETGFGRTKPFSHALELAFMNSGVGIGGRISKEGDCVGTGHMGINEAAGDEISGLFD
jgi:hypothetical protein